MHPCSIISGRQMSSLLVPLLHHRLWRRCSSVVLGSALSLGFSPATVPKHCLASCLVHASRLYWEEETQIEMEVVIAILFSTVHCKKH